MSNKLKSNYLKKVYDYEKLSAKNIRGFYFYLAIIFYEILFSHDYSRRNYYQFELIFNTDAYADNSVRFVVRRELL